MRGRASRLSRICGVRTLFVALLLTATASAASTLAEARAVASDGRDFLALWDSQGLHASVILDAGGVARSTRLGTRKTIDAAAAWNGETYVVAWIEVEGANPNDYTYVAHWARLSAGGEHDPAGSGAPVSLLPPGASFPRVASNGQKYLLLWADGGALKSLECDSTLQPLAGATPQPVVRPDRRRATRP